MSAVQAVANKVKELGSATQGELATHFPEWTAQQLLDAIKNARVRGLIHCYGRVPLKGPSHGSLPTRNFPGPRPKMAKGIVVPHPARFLPIASVWELGTPRFHELPQGQGRVFNLLGSWES